MFWRAFTYGAVLHLVLLRAIAHWEYNPPANRSVIDHPLTNLIFTLLGGLFVGWLGARLYNRVHVGSLARRRRAILLGGAYGVAATELTIEASCIVAAVALACHVAGAGGVRSFPFALFLSFVDIQTYAMGLVVQIIPFSLAYGFAGGLWLARTGAR